MGMQKLEQVCGGMRWELPRDVSCVADLGVEGAYNFEPEDLEKLAAKYGFTYKYYSDKPNVYIYPDGKKEKVQEFFWYILGQEMKKAQQ